MNWSEQQVTVAVAQVRKWVGSADNGWAPSRPQAQVLADTVESQAAELDDLRLQRDAVRALHRYHDNGDGYSGFCLTCVDAEGGAAEWPCPTAQALGVTTNGR